MGLRFSLNNNSKEPKAFCLSIVVIACLYIGSCDTPASSSFEINGDCFKGTSEEKEYLARTYEKDFSGNIPWPPDNLGRIVDISLDVTGSVYQREVIFQDHRMSLAEYNLRKLVDYLSTNDVLQAGDRIFMRLFGAKPGGVDIISDQASEVLFPAEQVELKVQVFSRIKLVKITGHRVASDHAAYRKQVVEFILNWFLQHVKESRKENEQYMNSPLLEHIGKIRNLYQSKNSSQKLFIFATDGHFNLGEYYFGPANYTKDNKLPDKIKQSVLNMKIKPFTENDANSTVILFGLTSNDRPMFRIAQEDLLKWFFEPQPVMLIRNE